MLLWIIAYCFVPSVIALKNAILVMIMILVARN